MSIAEAIEAKLRSELRGVICCPEDISEHLMPLVREAIEARRPGGEMTPAEKFAALLMSNYWATGAGDIDWRDIGDMAVKSGLCIERPVTQKDIAVSECLQEWDIEPGDLWVFATPEFLALTRELK